VYLDGGQTEQRARRAEDRAEEANELAEQANDQYQRIADALDRLSDGQGSEPGEPVSFALERRANAHYTLRNLGPEVATSVTVNEREIPFHERLPDGVRLRPLAGHMFVMTGKGGDPLPAHIEVACDQLRFGVIVPVPPV
jgi:hypothetical protein